MQKLKIFNYFSCILSEIHTLEKYRGKEGKILELVITGEEFTSICPNRLKMFTKCKILKVLKTNLEHIPYGVEHLQDLKEFHYCDNKSIGTDEDFARLKGLKKLKSLHLKNNNIKALPFCLSTENVSKTGLATFIAYNTNIAGLFLKFSYKKYLATLFSFFSVDTDFPALIELNISDNQINDLPDWIFRLTKIETFNASGNKLINMNEKISLLSNLTELNLSRNKIKIIPDEIRNAICLKICDMSCNHITSIPKSFFSLNKLREANLSNNKLEELSIIRVDLSNLVVLNIKNNNLTYLMIQQNALPKLTYLNVSNNKLRYLPNNIGFPKQLRFLYLTKNFLYELPQLSSLSRLQCLNISHNYLRVLPDELCSLDSLHALIASFNCLIKLPVKIGNLRSLRLLEVETNLLLTLPSSFSNLKCIEKLNVSNNLFEEISPEIFGLDNLVTLFFNDNLLENLGTDDSVKHSSNSSTDNKGCNIQIATACKKNIFSLEKLQKIYFENNKITEISRDISMLKNLKVISLKNNEIKTIPEEIGELKELQVLNLKSNSLGYLPRSIEKLKKQSLNVLHIDKNYISRHDTTFGLGINSIIKLKITEVEHRPQYINDTIDDVVNDIKEDALHWNLDELKTIKLPIDISEFSTKISDKQMRKIWRVVLKYFLVTEEMIEDEDSGSSDEENTDVDDKIAKITALDAFKDIKANAMKGAKHLVIDRNTYIYLPLYKKVSKLLRNNSAPQTENPIVTYKMQELLKNSIKAIFYKFLDKIIEDNNDFERLEIIKIAITELCENKLLTCIDGQLEGLQYYYSMFYSSGNEVTNNSIIDFIKDIIASNKEMAFVNVTNGEGEHGVHNISRWRAVFKDVLGIQHSFDDPYSNMVSIGNLKYKTGHMLNDFFTKFTVDNVITDVVKKINATEGKLNESLSLLKDILKLEHSDVDDYTLYMNVIENFYEYKTISGYSELQPTKLTKNGLVKILLHLKILAENKEV